MHARQSGIARTGIAVLLLIAAAIVILFLLPTPSRKPATDVASAKPVTNANCIAVPKDFSQPAVIAPLPPASVWKNRHYGASVKLDATPSTALVDQPVDIRVTGLPSDAPVTLRASMTGYQKHAWLAEATFFANAQGVVDVAKAAPKYGDYSGVHAMGLVWSMQPQHVKQPNAVMWGPASLQYPVKLEALADGRVLATMTLTREFAAPGVKRTAVNENGLVGELYTPATPGPHPAVIVLGGSEGGLYPQVNEAAWLASHGYIALGLGYFQGFGGGRDPRLASLPKSLVNIPLEYFAKAADWLRKQPGVDPRRVAIMGWSKGAEASLLAAAEFPKDFQAVVAVMPSSVVWPGLDFEGPASSSWTLRGKPLPWLDFAKMDPAVFTSGKPVAFVRAYRPALNNTDAADKAAIPVERIAGPVLLVSAGDDQVWPSSLMARRIMQRLSAHHHPYHDRSLCYAQAGHAILPPWRPTNANAGGMVALGGDPAAYAFADQDAWSKALVFLGEALSARP